MNMENKKAIALKYKKEEQRAPSVAAKGKGHIADKIIEIAKEYDIPLYEDQDLAESLYPLELEMEIPPKLYQSVAEVIAYIYRLKNKKRS